MDNKVSDFKLSESMIKKICRTHGVRFVDVSLSFDEKIDGALYIGKTKNIAHTIFKIIAEYIDKSLVITGVQFMPDTSEKDNFLITLATNIRGLIYGEDGIFDEVEDSHALRLYQYPLVWILLKDIICPVYNKDILNLKVVSGQDPQVDIATYYDKEEIPDDVSREAFVFVNVIDNRVVQNAFLFMEVLKAYELSPSEVVKNIYESDLHDKYKGLLRISLESDDELIDFECGVLAYLGVNFYNLMANKVGYLNPEFIKTAQNSVPGLPNQFWQNGILEKMMQPVRGTDWSVYENLEPYIKEFWDKVEEVRLQRIKTGHDDGVPFDTLLRIKSKQTVDFQSDPNETIQALLSSERVW
jgi:hypothetical protein